MDGEISHIVIAVFGALGIRELLAYILTWIRARNKDTLELETLTITNSNAELSALEKAFAQAEALTETAQNQLNLINQLQIERARDKSKIDQKDGIIGYQQAEYERVFDMVSALRGNEASLQDKITNLERRVAELEHQNRELIGLREENTTLATQALRMRAILKELRLQGVWDGDETKI